MWVVPARSAVNAYAPERQLAGAAATQFRRQCYLGAVVFIYAAAILLMDTASTKASFAYGKTGAVAILKIKGNKVTKVGQVPAGGLPEGAAWSSDGRYLFVENYMERNLQTYELKGRKFGLPGQPAALRAVTR